MPLNRAYRDWADVDALVDSAFSNYVAADVMVEVITDNVGANRRHEIWQISSGAVIDPNAISTYDQAPTGSHFTDNAGQVWRKTGATTWVTGIRLPDHISIPLRCGPMA